MIKLLLRVFLVFSFGFLVWPESTVEYYIKPELPIITKEKPASIKLTGKSNLPDKTILTIVFHYIIFEKKSLIDIKKCQVENGSYSLEFTKFKGSLPAGEYQFIIEFDPQRQYQEIKNLLGNKAKPIQESISIHLGTQEDIEKERNEMMKGVKEASQSLIDLTTQLKNHFKTYLNQEFQPEIWENCYFKWREKLANIRQSLDALDTLGVFTRILWAKLQMKKLTDGWEYLANLCEKALSPNKSISTESYEKIIKEFYRYEEDLKLFQESLGIREVEVSKLQESINQLELFLDTMQKELSVTKVISKEYLTEKEMLVRRLLLTLGKFVSTNDYYTVSEISRQILSIFEDLSRGGLIDVAMLEKFKSKKAIISKHLAELRPPSDR